MADRCAASSISSTRSALTSISGYVASTVTSGTPLLIRAWLMTAGSPLQARARALPAASASACSWTSWECSGEQPRETIYPQPRDLRSGLLDIAIVPAGAARSFGRSRRPMVIAARGELAPSCTGTQGAQETCLPGRRAADRIAQRHHLARRKPAEADEIHAAIGAPRENIRIAGNLPTLLRADQKHIFARRVATVAASPSCR